MISLREKKNKYNGVRGMRRRAGGGGGVESGGPGWPPGEAKIFNR